MADDDKGKDAPAKGDDKDEPLGDAGKRALQAERERAKKAEADLKAARDELDKLKADNDASKSEMDKVRDEIAALKKDAEESQARAMRAEVAQSKGLTAAQAKRLSGASREELEADADELLEAFKPSDDGKGDDKPTTGRPKEKLRPDPGDSGEPQRSGQELADEVWKRTRGES